MPMDGALISAILAGLGGMALSFTVFFRDWEDFLTAVKYVFTPDIISLFNGEWAEDQWNEFKFFIWMVVGVIFGVCGWQGYGMLFGG